KKLDELPSEWVAEFNRNQWTNWIGTGGRFASESVAELARNTQFELSLFFSSIIRCSTNGRGSRVDQGVLGQLTVTAKRYTSYVKPAHPPAQGALLSDEEDNKIN
ncbi:MAG: hypothetical protein K0A93_12070, partial [Desulfuromonadaceae bacterium]|nr:hypothetical protein [Desulfuromonadaceae bacterium]